MRTIEYGDAKSQVGDLFHPGSVRPAVVCLLHGGFWRMPYGRAEFAPVARDLALRGWAVWNLEYRRVGEPGGGWPGTLEDVATGVDHLATLAGQGADLDLDRVVLVGHSAGGQLALWCAARSPARRRVGTPMRVTPAGVAGLGAVVDLERIYRLGSGSGAVGALLAGSPEEHPDRYASASPRALLPLGAPQLIVHGESDEALPIGITRDYVTAARGMGDTVTFADIPGGTHMNCLDTGSESHAVLCRWLTATLGPPSI